MFFSLMLNNMLDVCGCGGGCCGTAAAAAMLEFQCVTSILVLATSILVLVAKL